MAQLVGLLALDFDSGHGILELSPMSGSMLIEVSA